MELGFKSLPAIPLNSLFPVCGLEVSSQLLLQSLECLTATMLPTMTVMDSYPVGTGNSK